MKPEIVKFEIRDGDYGENCVTIAIHSLQDLASLVGIATACNASVERKIHHSEDRTFTNDEYRFIFDSSSDQYKFHLLIRRFTTAIQ